MARYTKLDIALSVGGLDIKTQEVDLRQCPDIVIATPGRLIDHIKNTPSFSLERIEVRKNIVCHDIPAFLQTKI